MNTVLFHRRKLTDKLMFFTTGVFTLISLSALFFALGYIAYHGMSSISWDFLTKLPKPVGETGGGIANSIVGSLKVVGLASLIGIPVGVLGGVYLAEFGGGKTGFLIRYCADVVNG
jgi:phosphate transport system permease protein